MAHFVAMNFMIPYTPNLSIFLAKCVFFRQISQNHSNKKGLMVNEFYIETKIEILCFLYLLLKKTDKQWPQYTIPMIHWWMGTITNAVTPPVSSVTQHHFERICPYGGSIGQIWSRFGVGVRSFSWNWIVRNSGVFWESSMYFRGTLRRLSTRQKWDWHMPDICWHATARNMAQEFGLLTSVAPPTHFPLTLD